jgi:ABC-type dipeptide/oligopeptide/nickel transport system ATPase component
MFSYKEGTPIAFVKNNKKDDILYISTKHTQHSNNDIVKFNNAKIIPDIERRQVIYICGQSGCGKSTFAGAYVKQFKKLFKKADIYIFSRKKGDPAYDKYNPYYIPIDERLYEEPIDITEELKDGGLVIFDDTSTISDDKIKTAVSKLLADILEVGRSFKIYCIITSHLINSNDRKETRVIMNELTDMVIFPRACNRYALTYALTKYFGIDKKKIEGILKLNSKWALIHKNFPMYVLHEKGGEILL